MCMTNYIARFSFYKAGQGLFYGGHIKKDEGYTIVYDCGSSNKREVLSNEIDRFVEDLYAKKKPQIDLLFISHLDYDHVSGLKELLGKCQVKRIILPYIDVDTRKYFFTSVVLSDDWGDDENIIEAEKSGDSVINSLGSSKTIEFYEEYFELIKNPVNFIKTYSKNEEIEIFFIQSGESPKNETPPRGDENPDIIVRGTVDPNDIDSNGKAFIYKNDLQFFIRSFWEFTTFVKELDPEIISAFRKELCKIAEKEKLDLDDIKKIVIEKRKEVRKCYDKFMGDINSYGIVLFHKPIEKDVYSNSFCFSAPNDYSVFYRHYLECETCQLIFVDWYIICADIIKKNIDRGTLLLGDMSIKTKDNTPTFTKPFLDKILHPSFVQLPHHGSGKSCDIEGLQKNNLLDDEKVTFFICNFGLGNKYGHPSYELLLKLTQVNGNRILNNTQISRIETVYYN